MGLLGPTSVVVVGLVLFWAVRREGRVRGSFGVDGSSGAPVSF